MSAPAYRHKYNHILWETLYTHANVLAQFQHTYIDE